MSQQQGTTTTRLSLCRNKVELAIRQLQFDLSMMERRAADSALSELEDAGPRGPTATQLRHFLRIVSHAII